MAFTITASSVRYNDLAGGSEGLAMITGSVVLDAGTTSGVLNPVTISALSGIQGELVNLIANCRSIRHTFVQPTGAADTTRAVKAYDATTDSDQVTVTVGTANTNIDFMLLCRKAG